MNVIVYGVHHWSNEPQTLEHINSCQEWYNRIIKFIPNVNKVIIATGNLCNPEFSPFPKEVQIVQNNIPYTQEYTRDYNYFRNGFMTGIWHSLLNEKNWDILFHIQGRVLIGEPLGDFLEFFNKSNYLVMAPKFTQFIGTSIEISIFAMKLDAVRKYATSTVRASFNVYGLPDLNCEEEAYVMFNDSWYNPWKSLLTTRQIDTFVDDEGCIGEGMEYSPFAILNPQHIIKLPFISTGEKHITNESLKLWKEYHPC